MAMKIGWLKRFLRLNIPGNLILSRFEIAIE